MSVWGTQVKYLISNTKVKMATALPAVFERETLLLRLAREVASDLHDIQTILKQYSIEPKQWETIKTDPRFLKHLEAAMVEWNAAGNTPERVKLKSAMLIEEWLPTANTLAHGTDGLSAKTELMKFIASLAQMGKGQADVQAGGGFKITINLGADHKLQFDKQPDPPMIDATPTQES